MKVYTVHDTSSTITTYTCFYYQIGWVFPKFQLVTILTFNVYDN